ncbi:hypothetical protein [Psychrobacter lutiphocae]|uniref:hypothetical protein n=1 Tax=Psychrobacter lutiphocae TaxID=540500 RepID=UPI000381D392|nr:hypothetical protein [Psychrobacter lutiphocae]
MTQVAFSHQFSQRWIDTPAEIKNALLQRLDDIVRLLDEDTDLDSFEFSIADLDGYLDDLYAQMATEIAEKQAEAQAEAERAAAEQAAAEEQAQAEQQAEQVEAFDVDIDEAEEVTEQASVQTTETESASSDSQHSDEHSEAASPAQQPVAASVPPAFNFERTEGELDAEFIKDLECSIDDYLSDQLSSMSEDLKSWLREAIENRLKKQSKK